MAGTDLEGSVVPARGVATDAVVVVVVLAGVVAATVGVGGTTAEAGVASGGGEEVRMASTGEIHRLTTMRRLATKGLRSVDDQ